MNNEQLLGLTEHLILLSAFFGGFSATFLAAILAIAPAEFKKIANCIVIGSALAACCFIVCATSSIALANGIQAAPLGSDNAFDSLKSIRVTSVLSMLLGVFSLLGSIGLSGWLRGRKVGIVTSSISVLAIIIVGTFA